MITLEQVRSNLQKALKESGYKQAEVARKLNLSSQTVSCYFNGKKLPALDMFANLCKELDIDPAYVLGLTE